MKVPVVQPLSTGVVPTALLDFDRHNPRLVEDLERPETDEEIIRALADNADLSELIESIAANGYIDIEPLIVEKQNARFRVLEGNRRLAAVRVLLEPSLAKGSGLAVPKITPAVRKTLTQVTVYAVSNPDQARDFIGFKHINGPHRWDAVAKARFAADWYRKESGQKNALTKIAKRLGDRHDTVVRLVNAMFVLDQAKETGAYDVQDRFPGKSLPSHICTSP